MNCSVYQGKTKKGKDFTALKIKIGEYETLVFPTKIELMYIQNYINAKSKNEFQEEFLDDVDSR